MTSTEFHAYSIQIAPVDCAKTVCVKATRCLNRQIRIRLLS